MGEIRKRGFDSVAGPCQHKPVSTRCDECILDTSYYFFELSVNSIRELQHVLELKKFERRSKIYREGDRVQNVYILISGEIKVYRTLPNGRQQIYKLVQVPGDIVACEVLFLDQHNSTAEVVGDASVCCIKKSDLLKAIEVNSEISDVLMRSMARHLNAYIRHISNLTQKTALERVASYLLFLQDTHLERSLRNEELVESLTRTELADMIGVTQRTLIRSLKYLESENVISLTKEGFVITDQDSLVYLSEGI